MRVPILSAAAAALLASACASSPPVRYYVLTAIPAGTPLATPADMVPVRLERLTIPTELDRSELLRRMDATRVDLLEDDRWAAPLDDMIRRVLTSDLAARLPPGRVTDPNEPPGSEHRQSLAVDIQRFDGDPACAVTLRAVWVLKKPEGSSVRGSEEERIASGTCSGAASLPPAMSQALAQLSDRLAAVLARSADAGISGDAH